MYQFHFFRHFSIVAGYEGTFVFNYVNDNGYPQDNWEPANIHSAFIGIAI